MGIVAGVLLSAGTPSEKQLKKMARQGQVNPDSPQYVVNGIPFRTIRAVPVDQITRIVVYPFDPDDMQDGVRLVYGKMEVEWTDDTTARQGIVGEIQNPDKVLYQPSFMGGDFQQFRTWLQINLRYPLSALSKKIDGGVQVRFTVDERGVITEVETLESDHKILESYLVSLLKEESPGWLPAIENGRPQKTEFTIAVEFRLAHKTYPNWRFPEDNSTIITVGAVM